MLKVNGEAYTGFLTILKSTPAPFVLYYYQLLHSLVLFPHGVSVDSLESTFPSFIIMSLEAPWCDYISQGSLEEPIR